MADTALKQVNIDTMAEVELLQKDVGSSQHVPGMMVVDATGVAIFNHGAAVHANPSVPNATSTTVLLANASRKYVRIQNNSAANIAVSLSGATLTGIAPTAAVPCLVIAAGGFYENPPHFCPTGNISVYQSSGGAIETISVVSY